MSREEATLTIRDVAHRTGIAVGTLRMWEQRHGFPVPTRQIGGHRRYREQQCDELSQIVADRQGGLSLAAAIDRARQAHDRPPTSVYAALRDRCPTLAPSVHTRRTMSAISRAIEDESSSTADRPVLVGAFQTETAYRSSQHRWTDLAAGAELAVVLAAFGPRRPRRPSPTEVALAPGAPLCQEWVVACHGPRFTACLAAWERPTPAGTPDHRRLFEAIWTVEPQAVREAIEITLELDRNVDPAVAARARAALDRPPRVSVGDAASAVRLANRMLAYATPGPT